MKIASLIMLAALAGCCDDPQPKKPVSYKFQLGEKVTLKVDGRPGLVTYLYGSGRYYEVKYLAADGTYKSAMLQSFEIESVSDDSRTDMR